MKTNEKEDLYTSDNISEDGEVFKRSSIIPGELCATGSIVEGTVSGIAKFGAFVDLPDKRTGLVHISQISDGFVREVRDYLQIGQKVNVYIIKCEGEKIRLSIKDAHSKLGIPQLSPLGINNVSGGLDKMLDAFRYASADNISTFNKRYDRKIH